MISDDCFNRIVNWKFRSAFDLIDFDASPDEREVIGALAAMFGNIGWFGGDMGLIVQQAIRSLDLSEVGRE